VNAVVDGIANLALHTPRLAVPASLSALSLAHLLRQEDDEPDPDPGEKTHL
jgi:hypothetical protein